MAILLQLFRSRLTNLAIRNRHKLLTCAFSLDSVKFIQHSSIQSNESDKLTDFNEAHSNFNALDKVDPSTIDLINDISPSLKKSFNLAAYANVSETLQQLVKLNVDLSKFDKHTDLASYVVKCNFETDIKPLILLLLNNKVSIDDVGSILSKNPFLLTECRDDIQVRINYFLFKKFNQNEIASILVRAPQLFSLNAKTIDLRLGILVDEYQLSAVELRHVVKTYPRIVLLKRMQIKDCTFMFNEEFGFKPEEVKSIIIKYPILWKKFHDKTGHADYVRIFNFIHNDMGFSHKEIIKYPRIFNRRLSLIRPRHLYLKTLNRAQYDHTKPLYVPLSAFYEFDDSEFCERYTKTSINDYNEFLKTI